MRTEEQRGATGASAGGAAQGDEALVSVIIPAYNRAHTISRAIDSVLAQTYSHFEILVVDDGSTDRTAELVTGYADPRVHYFRQLHNQGVAAARNRGMREARGALFAFLDSDDEWLPEKLAAQLAVLRDAPEGVGLCYTGVEVAFDDGTHRVRHARYGGELFVEMMEWNRILATSGVLMRRGVYETVGEFDEGIPAQEDYDYWLRVTKRYHVAFVADPLTRYYEAAGFERKTHQLRENVDARVWLYRKHQADMGRADRAHPFLLHTAQLYLAPELREVNGALRLAVEAVRTRPLRLAAYPFLGRVLLRKLLPESSWRALRAAWRSVR